MFLLIFLLYVIAEVTALVLLAQAIGILWTVAVVLGATALGFMLFGMQTRAALRQLSELSRGAGSPAGAVTDTMLITIGGVLLVIPGLVTTVLGLLLLFPPTRALLRPVVMFLAVRRYQAAVATGSVGWTAVRTYRTRDGGAGVVDGVVVSEHTVEGDSVDGADETRGDPKDGRPELRPGVDDTPDEWDEGQSRRDQAH